MLLEFKVEFEDVFEDLSKTVIELLFGVQVFGPTFLKSTLNDSLFMIVFVRTLKVLNNCLTLLVLSLRRHLCTWMEKEAARFTLNHSITMSDLGLPYEILLGRQLERRIDKEPKVSKNKNVPNVTIFVGGPGTGKTYQLNQFVREHQGQCHVISPTW